MKESSLLTKFLVEYSASGHRLFRFQSGLFWAGRAIIIKESKSIHVTPGTVVIKKPRRVKSGHVGMSDLLGFTQVTITPEMVGRKFAVFTAVEGKTEKVKVTKEQNNFIRMVNQMGGIGVIAKKLDHLFEAMNKFIEGNHETYN